MLFWQDRRIDTRGISSGVDAYTAKKVSGWINSANSRPRFDRVMEELGHEDTVEAVFVHSKFEPLSRQSPAARLKAKGRLDGTVRD